MVQSLETLSTLDLSRHNLITGVYVEFLELHGLDFSLAVNCGCTIKCAKIDRFTVWTHCISKQVHDSSCSVSKAVRWMAWAKFRQCTVINTVHCSQAWIHSRNPSHPAQQGGIFNGARFSGLASLMPEHRSCNNISQYKLTWTARIVNRIHIRMWVGENEVSVLEPKEAVYQHGVERWCHVFL